MASKGFRSAVAGRGAALGLAVVIVTAMVGSLVLRAPGSATAAGSAGYWLAGSDGGVFNYGQAPFYGSAGAAPLNSPIVGFVPTPSAAGYWMVAGDGGIFAFGDAGFFGSMGGKPLNKPIASMGPSVSGKGYWLVASDGGIFAFGDAPFFGSLAGEKLSRPIVDFAPTPTGQGYWMTTSDGQVYGFGDAGYYGSVDTAVDLTKRIQALAPTPTGRGYWLVGGDGGIFAFGDAGYYGAAAGRTDKRVIDIAPTPTGRGYYLVTSNGQVFPYGDAVSYGDASRSNLNDHITAMAAVIPGAGHGVAGPTGLQAVDDTADGKEDDPLTIDVTSNDQAPSGGTLTLQSVNPPAHGQARVSGNRVVYEPAPDYNGPDAFTYTVTDGGGATSTGTVRLTLAPVNDKPVAVDDEATITDGGATTVDVVANDKGLGDGLKSVTVTKGPAHGQAAVQPDNKIGYTPAAGFNGSDGFEYRVTDVDDESSTGWVKITIGGANRLPVAVDDSVTARAGRQSTLDVTKNDDPGDGVREVRFADPGGAPMDALDIGTQSGGSAHRDGTKISYTAPPGAFTGPDSFSYVLIDNNGDVSKPATVRANVGRNQAPQVKDGYVSVPQNRQAVGSIAKLGWDPEKDPITFELRSSPAGQLTLKPDGTFLYQAPAGVQVDDFSFVANDGNSESNEGHLSIKITEADAATSSSSSTTTTRPASSGSTWSDSNSPSSANTSSSSSNPSSGSSNWSSGSSGSPSSSGSSSSSTTPTTRGSSTASPPGKSSNSRTSGKGTTSQSTGKSKKPTGSNDRGKSTSSTKSKSK